MDSRAEEHSLGARESGALRVRKLPDNSKKEIRVEEIVGRAESTNFPCCSMPRTTNYSGNPANDNKYAVVRVAAAKSTRCQLYVYYDRNDGPKNQRERTASVDGIHEVTSEVTPRESSLVKSNIFLYSIHDPTNRPQSGMLATRYPCERRGYDT